MHAMKKKIGLIGYGMIGSYLLKRIERDSELEIAFVYDFDTEKTAVLRDSIVVKDPKNIGEKAVDLVVEAADFRAVRSFAHAVLKRNNMLILSVSALADTKFADELNKICETNGTKMYIPHGALLGMDGLQDARDSLDEVSIVTRKHPRNIDFSFTDKFKREDIIEETVLYDGPTRGACKLFPRNVNSHAVVAISGIGFDKTKSKLIADPKSSMAKHHVIAKSKNTVLEIKRSSTIKGVTGEYTLISVYGTMKRILSEKYVINIF